MTNRLTFSEAIAARGIDATREISQLKRRARYTLNCDRAKVFASTPLGSIPSPWNYDRNGNRITDGNIKVDLQTLKLAGLVIHHFITLEVIPPSTADYVAAWCRLNHLKP